MLNIRYYKALSYWNIFLVVIWISFAIVQLGGQYGIFTEGKNAYTVYAEYDVITHTIGAIALSATLIRFLNLPEEYDQWRYWVLFLMGIAVFFWEGVELIITIFKLMPPDKMFATTWNSFKDIVIGLLSTCTACFIWEMTIEQKKRSQSE